MGVTLKGERLPIVPINKELPRFTHNKTNETDKNVVRLSESIWVVTKFDKGIGLLSIPHYASIESYQ